MIEWLGPIVYEYYSATEVYLLTAIDSEDWLAHRGSVGKALLGHAAHPRRRRQRARQSASRGPCGPRAGPSSSTTTTRRRPPARATTAGWTTVGDIGYLDADGYLYLTDRKADMIISGGVNVYPQEAENVLIGHPAVDDVAVFGIPQPGSRRGGQGASCSCAPATARTPSSRPS